MLLLLYFIAIANAQATCCCALPGSSLCIPETQATACTQGGGTCAGPVLTSAPTTALPPSTCACVVATDPGQCWCQFSAIGALPADPATCQAAGFSCTDQNPSTEDFLGGCYPDVPTDLCIQAQGSCGASACIAADQNTCCCLLPGSQECQEDASAEWCVASEGQCEGAPVALVARPPSVTCACIPPGANEKVAPGVVTECIASGGLCRQAAADLNFDGRVGIDDLANLLVQYNTDVWGEGE
jgi:hypothetical protein